MIVLMVLLSSAAMLLGEVMFAPVPPSVVPKNAIERLVLARPESASRDLETSLAKIPDKQDRDRQLTQAGFKRVRPEHPCANYVYSRQLSGTVVRGASVILCEGKAPSVLRTDETPGPWLAPQSGQLSPSVPSAPHGPA